MPRRQSAIEQVAEAVDVCVDTVFALVDSVRSEVLVLAHHPERRPRSADLAPLELDLRAALAKARHPRLAGLGFIAALEVFQDEPRFIKWVRHAEDGSMSMLMPDLDPDSLGFYDFTAATWFQNPLTTGARSIVGPYVDFAGTDEYVITFTVPVESDGDVLGVGGADIRLGDLANTLMPSLCSTGVDAALINTAGRVIVSSSPEWQVGALLGEDQVTVLERCARAPWSVVGSGGPDRGT